MSTLIFDIETIGEDFDSLDGKTQDVLTHWIRRETDGEEDYKEKLDELKNRLGFSPLTGEIVAIGVLSYEKNEGVIYFQAPGETTKEFQEDGFTFRQATEKEMLEEFWRGAKNYTNFVSFNGRSFDVPFLMTRSAIHKIKPSKNLMSNRYLNLQKFDAKHVDLMEQLTFYGAVRRRSGLHLCCRAFGIQSPKSQGVTGDDVAPLFKEKKFIEIAKYNAGDLTATKELYEYWKNYISFDRI